MKNIRCLNCNWIVPIIDAEPGKTWRCPKCGSPVLSYPPTAIVSQNSVCAYCGTTIGDDEVGVCCPGCRIEYHEACWNDGEGCQTVGCGNKGVLKNVEKIDPVPEGLWQGGNIVLDEGTQSSSAGGVGTTGVGFFRLFLFYLLTIIGRIFIVMAKIFKFFEQISSKLGNFYIQTGAALKADVANGVNESVNVATESAEQV